MLLGNVVYAMACTEYDIPVYGLWRRGGNGIADADADADAELE